MSPSFTATTVAAAIAAFAFDEPKPLHIFMNGEVANAADVNHNFEFLQAIWAVEGPDIYRAEGAVLIGTNAVLRLEGALELPGLDATDYDQVLVVDSSGNVGRRDFSIPLGAGSVTTDALADGAVTSAKLHAMGAATGNVMTWTGAAWLPVPPVVPSEIDPTWTGPGAAQLDGDIMRLGALQLGDLQLHPGGMIYVNNTDGGKHGIWVRNEEGAKRPFEFENYSGSGGLIVQERPAPQALEILVTGTSTGDGLVIDLSNSSGEALVVQSGNELCARFFESVLIHEDLEVEGTLSKAGGTFKIDHPLHPDSKYLYHSFVESPDMMNVYNGNVTTDAAGRAWVELPSYFEALNSDYRYQLTPIGTFARVMVESEVENSRFAILSDEPYVRVSWQITGIRQDPWAVANRVHPEVDKAAAEVGRFLHPELYGFPREFGVRFRPRSRESTRSAADTGEDVSDARSELSTRDSDPQH